ncbi:MAG TPA: hydroxyacylglutathione hydrolase [Dokdonella sp.]|uniref:hydroxyacylglutathione hydrolase n=1 Tax=Dokdonella sp. TaxID=2291710 RepID=UPI0025BE332B|nr:hydroxyacylglutathione hydrolase [Dokdonella sp.]MBX3692764.1 hydroxyacylglutathione hydrolase [Dokdonella sp.]MCW5568636.1 hydroxyacylglutathione hydrolase [Dokdonella sp.]HNR91066.1 hydroxyacylglutathione hydrolase [Dokdonella sp.]
MTGHRLFPVRALRDNYVWVLANAGGDALVVDPGEAAPVIEALHARGLRLRAILLTHHHADHIDGVSALMAAGDDIEVIAPFDERIATATRRVGAGDCVEFRHPASRFEVIEVHGHTRSHIAYHGEGLLFCGDTLFSIGCGRLFEGTPAQMLDALDRLAALPGTTQVCCGHEYTLANCAFAMHVDPHNATLRARAAEARAAIASGKPSLPSLLADERACNPFLRVDAPELVAAVAAHLPADANRVARFATLRRLKDEFRT